MDWLILVPVLAAAIWLYVWFKPSSVAESPKASCEAGDEPAPHADRERPAVVAILHTAEQQDQSAFIRS